MSACCNSSISFWTSLSGIAVQGVRQALLGVAQVSLSERQLAVLDPQGGVPQELLDGGDRFGSFIQIQPRHGGAERQEDDDVVVELVGAGGNDAKAACYLLAARLGPECSFLRSSMMARAIGIAEFALGQDQRHIFGGAGLRRLRQSLTGATLPAIPPKDGGSDRGNWCCARSWAARRGGEAEVRPACGRCPVPPHRRSAGRRR